MLGVTNTKSIVAAAPTKAKDRRSVFRYRPWSAAPDMDTITSAWSRTLMEKVYMAKLAVLISAPRMCTMHWPLSAGAVAVLMRREERAVERGRDGLEMSVLGPQGVVWSERRTPRSRASCSRVIGRKDPRSISLLQEEGHWNSCLIPIPHTTKTSAAQA